MVKLIEYDEAVAEVRAIYEDIARTRGIHPSEVNNAWKAQAIHPENMKRFWERAKVIMAPGGLDHLTKELIYLAVSISQQCEYCTASHSYQARAKGATEAMMAEMFAIVGLAVEGNRMASAYRIPVDEKFK